MKVRIEKKLSKKLALIMAGNFRSVWIDNEYERHTPHYKYENPNGFTPKQVRENREARSRVNHMPSVGGELDYWGEGTDWRSVWEEVKELLWWDKYDWSQDDPFEPASPKVPHPWASARMTGLFVLNAARKYANSKGDTK